MSNYGVTDTGFSRKRLAEIKSSLEARMALNLGVTISTGADSVFGNLIGTFAADIDAMWQIAEDTYNAMPPSTATGTNLTNSVAFTGVTRTAATSTKLYITCFGTSGTVLPSGSTVADTASNYYSTTESSSISLSNATNLVLSLSSVTVGNEYGLIIGDTALSYTAVTDDTVSTVLSSLVSQMPDGFTASNSNGVLTINSNDKTSGTSMSYGSYFTFVTVGSPIVFYANETGALDPTVNTMTSITTSVDGWDSIDNETAAIVGNDVETDVELRQRYANLVASIGTSTTEAIKANILELDGVTECEVFENDTNKTDESGRPAHTIEAIVVGGDANDIAEAIFNTRNCGIPTYGDYSAEVTDASGGTKVTYFNRPTEKLIYLKCTVHAQSGVTLSSDISTVVTDLLLDNSFSIGDDVILQKLVADVINGVDGLSYVELTGSEDGVNYSTNNIEISTRETAVFSSDAITVEIGV